MAATSDNSLNDSLSFNQLESYPWDEDQEFQVGLRAILGSVQDPAQVEHLTLRARCYYYARKSGTPIDFDAYRHWVEAQRQPTSSNGIEVSEQSVANSGGQYADASGGMANAPKPASFAEICDMIAEGKPIPGIKDIPDTILEGQASESQTATRAKPWERNDGANENPSWMT